MNRPPSFDRQPPDALPAFLGVERSLTGRRWRISARSFFQARPDGAGSEPARRSAPGLSVAQRALDYLFDLEQFGIKFGLDNMRALVGALDHPDRDYRVVHVAGTNGKGSVTAMIDAVLRSAGHRTGRYTSPHLVDLSERFVIDGHPVSAEQLDDAAADAPGADPGAAPAPVPKSTPAPEPIGDPSLPAAARSHAAAKTARLAFTPTPPRMIVASNALRSNGNTRAPASVPKSTALITLPPCSAACAMS